MKCIRCGSEMTPAIGGNYYCLKCDICLNDAVYRTTNVNVLDEFNEPNINNDAGELNATTIYKYEKEIAMLHKWLEEKDQRIKKLEEQIENKSELGLTLYTALAKQFEKQGIIDNIPSAIDQLVGKDCGRYADMYNEYKSLQRKTKELEEQIEKFKKGEIIPASVAEQSFKMRDKQLALYEKTLELALQCIDNENVNCKYCIHYTIDGTCNKAYGHRPCKEGFKEWLLQQVKEKIGA